MSKPQIISDKNKKSLKIKNLLTNIINKDKFNQNNLVISLKSMGYHYPIDQYLRLFQTCCDENTSFIFDVSDGYYNESLFKKHFESVDIIYEEKSIHSLKRLLCTKFKN